MARERSKDEILNEAVFAINQVARWYGPGFSGSGLVELKEMLSQMPLRCDSTWRVDYDDDDVLDFRSIIELGLLEAGVTMSKQEFAEEFRDTIARANGEQD